MEQCTISQIQKLTSPNPFVLVSTCDENGKNNLMAASWWSYLSNRPATIGVCLSQKGYSGIIIRKTGEFCLCLPDDSLKDAAFRCGTCSGRDADKAELFGIELEPGHDVKAQHVKHSAAVLECRLINAVDVQDHTLYIAEVVNAFLDSGKRPLFSMNGYGKLDII